MNLSKAALIFATALTLRAGVAIMDHFQPIFPDYHYSDARGYHNDAQRLLEIKRGNAENTGFPQGRRFYIAWTAALYSIFGETPLAPRLFNAAAGALTVLIWYFILASVFRFKTATFAAGLLAVWPSHIFYSAQHLKESGVLLLTSLIFALFLQEGLQPVIRNRRLAIASICLAMLTFFRNHFIPFIGISIATLSFFRARRREIKPALILIAWFAVGAGLKPIARALTNSPNETLISASVSEKLGETNRFSPSGISTFRKIRLKESAQWALNSGHITTSQRRIETQIFPNASFSSWLDLALFAPKVSFYSLFMPLPGLYSIDGKLGRALSAGENTILLLFFIVALLGARKFPEPAAGAALALFFLLTVPPAAFLEFDLGSAARHKLAFFPILLPFFANAADIWTKK